MTIPVGIAAKDLEFDSFKWVTPQVSAAGAVTMQVSLNNQDWHDAKDPNGSGFTYYQSPHVTAINPSYGHVKSANDQIIELTGSGFICSDS